MTCYFLVSNVLFRTLRICSESLQLVNKLWPTYGYTLWNSHTSTDKYTPINTYMYMCMGIEANAFALEHYNTLIDVKVKVIACLLLCMCVFVLSWWTPGVRKGF